MPLTSQQLARQRARALRDLTATCTILRPTKTRNDLGETVESFEALASGVPCRLVSVESQRGRDRLLYEGIGQVSEWLVVLPHDQDIHSSDRIAVDVPQVSGPNLFAEALPISDLGLFTIPTIMPTVNRFTNTPMTWLVDITKSPWPTPFVEVDTTELVNGQASLRVDTGPSAGMATGSMAGIGFWLLSEDNFEADKSMYPLEANKVYELLATFKTNIPMARLENWYDMTDMPGYTEWPVAWTPPAQLPLAAQNEWVTMRTVTIPVPDDSLTYGLWPYLSLFVIKAQTSVATTGSLWLAAPSLREIIKPATVRTFEVVTVMAPHTDHVRIQVAADEVGT